MSTKLSRYAEGLMEAAWLAAVIVVPLFFNIYSSRIFEPDKITLLRTLALIILAAWIVKLFEEGGVRWERISKGDVWWKTVIRLPLIAPVCALLLVYLIATIFSVTPRVSLFGSYQRLQGTYTTFSYIVIFFAMVVNLRRRAQVERLIGAAIIASLPVSLYGILQRNALDPIPWGGDVTARIASNMGNSIFVAAYLIMVFPLTALRIVEAFEALLTDRGKLAPNFVRATGYVFILALQTIALYYSGSRGPWLGWAASLVFIWLGLSLIWKTRWLTIAGVVGALLAGAFLVILNIPNGPLASLSERPEFGRLGQLLNTESRTGKVRSLIWLGASELVLPHEPLGFPDGSKDALNFTRPLIGYGPESMYVAYNRFYPPELTQVEKRNASPDRSHNETWDSLVITGIAGVAVYLTLFGAALYYGLKWLGLVQSNRQRTGFLALYLVGGLISSVVFVLWQGRGYLGVALPFGMILGVMVYLLIVSLIGSYQPPKDESEKIRAYILLALLAGIMAHFVEINFGIAIAATRTYFWIYVALLMLVGFVLTQLGEFGESAERTVSRTWAGAQVEKNGSEIIEEIPSRKKGKGGLGKKRRARFEPQARRIKTPFPDWLQEAYIAGFTSAILLVTLGYDYVTNASRAQEAWRLVWNSFTALKEQSSYGILALILTSWLVGTILLVSESIQEINITKRDSSNMVWIKMIAVALGVSLLLAFVFWLLHAANLSDLASIQTRTIDDVLTQVRRSEGILTIYYVYLALLLFGIATFLPTDWPTAITRNRLVSTAVAAGVLVVVIVLVSITNLRVIQADMAFKTGDLFANSQNWQPAIAVYNRARELAPNEDYYYLFLGRAYLEQAKLLDDPDARERFIAQSAQDLQEAQSINPLNTDHTANLARLFSLWSALNNDPTRKNELASRSEDYFARAVELSPNNARLWDEWASLYLNIMNLPDKGNEHLKHALDLDPYYDWTYGLLGDYTILYEVNDPNNTPEEKRAALEDAAEYYSQAIEHSDTATAAQKLSYYIGLAGVQSNLGLYQDAIQTYENSLSLASNNPNQWKIMESLTYLFAQVGDLQSALYYAEQALELSPDDQKERFTDLVTQLGGQP